MTEPPAQGLRWRCRRGMLELDVLLSRFLDIGYSQLDAEDRQRFETLLSAEDDVLWDWMTGRRAPEEQGIAKLVDRIRGV